MLFAAAAFSPLAALGKSPAFVMKDISLNDLSFAMLRGQVNTAFRVQATPSQAVELELVEAELAPEGPRRPGGVAAPADYESFSLIFRGALQEPLPQRIHKFEHPKLGRFELFIVPVAARDTNRIYYQAVFNRPAQGTASPA